MQSKFESVQGPVLTLAPSKIVGPTTRLVFMGIELDTVLWKLDCQQRNFHVYVAQFTLGKAGKAALSESYCH